MKAVRWPSQRTAGPAAAPDELGRAIDRIVLWQDGLTVGG